MIVLLRDLVIKTVVLNEVFKKLISIQNPLNYMPICHGLYIVNVK